jgi:hypothetical protein
MRNWVPDELNEHLQQALEVLVANKVSATVWWRGCHTACITADRVVAVRTDATAE